MISDRHDPIELLVFVQNVPRRSVIIRPRFGAVFALLLAHERDQDKLCSARFVKITEDHSYSEQDYRLLRDAPFYGCIGILQMPEGSASFADSYQCFTEATGLMLALISDCHKIGDLNDKAICGLERVQFYCLTSSKYDKQDASGTFYYSETWATRQVHNGQAYVEESYIQEIQVPHPCSDLVSSFISEERKCETKHFQGAILCCRKLLLLINL